MHTLQEVHNLTSLKVPSRPSKWRQNGLLPLLGLLFIALSACGAARPADGVTRQDLIESQNILGDYVATELRLNPLQAILLNQEADLPDHANLTFGDVSQAGLERRRLIRLELLDRLRARPRLPADQTLAQDLEIAAIKLAQLIALEQTGHVDASTAAIEIYSVQPFAGIWVQAPAILTQHHNINTVADAEAYLVRIAAFADALDDLRRRLRADAGTERGPPSHVLAASIRVTNALLSDHQFELAAILTVFQNLIGTVSEIESEKRAQLSARAAHIYNDAVLPAYTELLAELELQLEMAPEQPGLWARPTGADLYRQLLTYYEVNTLDPERLHSASAQAYQQMQQRFQSAITAYAMAKDPTILDAEGLDIETVLDAYYAENAAPNAFGGTLKPAVLEDPDESTSPARYIRFDIARTFTEYALSQSEDWPYALSEALRDNVLQIGFRTGDLNQARALTPFTPIERGIRLYALQENESDALATAHLLLFEVALAHADTGLHVERWTFAETVDFLEDAAWISPERAHQATLWLIVYPAMETAKFQAWQQIGTLAQRAQAVAGSTYSEPGFIDALTHKGPRPMAFIENDVEIWYGNLIEPAP